MTKSDTPGARARARSKPADPAPKTRDLDARRQEVLGLILEVDGVEYLIGPAIEGEITEDATDEGTATKTIPVRDIDSRLMVALKNEDLILKEGVFCTLDGDRYALQGVSTDETGLVTLVMEDEVSWRLRQYDKFLSLSRKKVTRAQFVGRLVKEASAPPLAPMRFHSPEEDERQPIAAAERDA